MGRPRKYASNAERQQAYRKRLKKRNREALRKASAEWYTPPECLDLVRRALGSIDLDPASCAYAQRTVQAKRWFGEQHDGLSRPWSGRVFLNPPYHYPAVERFTGKLLEEYEAGRVEAGICLVNNATDAEWFRRLFKRYPACFTKRIKFLRKGRKAFSPRLGQVFFYLGPDPDLFESVFRETGIVRFPTKAHP